MLTTLLAALLFQSAASTDDYTPGALFAKVADTLAGSGGFYDRAFRKDTLPGLIAEYRPYAAAATSLAAERAWVDAFLARIPASHLALWEADVHRHMMAELQNQKRPTLGLEVEQRGSRWFVYRLLEGGPAATAGVVRGDRVVAVDGVPIERSPLRQGSSDDAYLPDPPLCGFRVRDRQTVRLRVERTPGEEQELVVAARALCALDATRTSARVIAREGRRLGYIHFHYFQMTGPAAELRALLDEEWQDCDALVLDLRGRGGNAFEVQGLLSLFRGKRPRWTRPVVALIDRCTRSAKEAFAYDARKHHVATLVGEQTAGALVPASFQDVGQGYVLMYPASRLGEYSDAVELKGVAPDVAVADAGPYGAGADPILDRGVAVALQLVAQAAAGR